MIAWIESFPPQFQFFIWLIGLLIVSVLWLFFRGYYVEHKINNKLTKRKWCVEQWNDLINLRNVSGLLLGVGALLLLTPVGYGSVAGVKGFLDCVAFAAPCLAGIVVGLGLLDAANPDKEPVPLRAARTNPEGTPTAADLPGGPESIQSPSDQSALQVGQVSNAGVSQRTGRVDGEMKTAPTPFFPTLELKYYVYSVGLIFLGYVGFVGANFSAAIACWILITFSIYALCWAIYEACKRSFSISASEDILPTFLILALVVSLVFLTASLTAEWWSDLLPHKAECVKCHLNGKNAECCVDD